MVEGWWVATVRKLTTHCRTTRIRIKRVDDMNDVGKTLVVFGLIIAAVGLLLWAGFGKGWLGHLPGDIQYRKGNFTFYFPLATCLLISAILTLIMWMFRR